MPRFEMGSLVRCAALAALAAVLAVDVQATSYTATTAGPPLLWSNPTTWTPSAPAGGPTAGDDVAINGGVTVQLDVAIAAPGLNSFSNSGTLDIVLAGDLNLATTAGTFIVNNGGQIIHNGGKITIASGETLVINEGASFNWQSGTLTGGGTLQIINGSFAPDAVLTFNGPGTIDNAQVTNDGTINTNSTVTLTLQNAGRILNSTTGIFNITSSFPVLGTGGTATYIQNQGAIQKTDNSTTVWDAYVKNDGTMIAVAPARLLLNAGGAHTGSFASTAPGWLDFTGGQHAMNFSGISMSGNVRLTGGTMKLNTPLNAITDFVQTGGTLDGNSNNMTISGSFTFSGGLQNGGGSTIITATGTADFDGAVGTMTLQNRSFQTSGDVNYSPLTGRELALTSSGKVQLNNASADFNLLNDTGITGDGTGIFDIAVGTLHKTGGSGSSDIFATLNNNGTVSNEVASPGAINFKNGGTEAGQFTCTFAAAFIDFSAGIFTFGPGTSLATGTFRIYSASSTRVILTTPISTSHVILDSGGQVETVGGHAFNASTFEWKGGTLTGNGSTTIGAADTMTVAQSGTVSLSGWHIINNNNLNFASGVPNADISISGAAIIDNEANGHIRLQGSNQRISGSGGTLNNKSGAFLEKVSGGGLSTINAVFNNSGTVDNQVDISILSFRAGGSHNAGTMNASGGTSAGVEFATTPYTFNGGSFSGAGYFSVSGGTTINVNALSIVTNWQQNGNLAGAANFIIVNGGAWNTGTMSGGGTTFVGSGATFFILASAPAPSLDNRILNIQGIVNYTSGGGTLDISNGGKIVISSGGLLDLQDDSQILNTSGAGEIDNQGGTLRKSAGTLSVINVPVKNNNVSALIQPNLGAIELTAGGLNIGAVQTTASGAFKLVGGVFNWNGGSYSGTGALMVAATATLTLNGPLSVPILRFFAGTINGPSNLDVTNTFEWSGGTLTGSGPTGLTGTGIFQPSASSLFLSGRPFTNNLSSTINMTGSSATVGLSLSGGTTFTNNGTFDMQGDRPILGTAAETFANNNTFLKSSGAGTAPVSATFNNSGQVDVQSGRLQLLAGGTDSGAYKSPNPAASLEFAGGTRTLGGTSTIGPSPAFSGTVVFSGGTTAVSGTYDVAAATQINGGIANFNGGTPAAIHNLSFSAGTLGGTASVQVSGTGSWTGGTITGAGAFNLSGPLTIGPGASNPTLDGRTISNSASVTYTANTTALTMSNGAQWINGITGFFDVATDQPIAVGIGSASIANGGTFRKTAGFGATSVQPIFSNTNTVQAQSGTIDFGGGFTQTAGTTTLGPGNLSSTFGPMQFNGGFLQGNGFITSVVNAATVQPGLSPGQITINGTYTQTSSGTLNIELGGTTPATQYDVLSVNGSVTLDGTLNVTFFGGYLPAGGETFQPLTFTSRTGDFATYNLPPWSGTWSTSYTPTALVLSAVAAVLSADLSISQAPPGVVTRGVNFNIPIAIANGGPDAATSVSFTDTFSNLNFVAAAGATCSPTGPGTVNCTVGTINSGGNAPVTLTFNAPAAGSATNAATVTSATGDPTPGNNSTGPASITVLAVTDLAIAIADAPDPVNTSSNVTYTVTVTNNGPDTSVASPVSMSVSGGGTIVSAAGSGCTNTTTTASCTAPPLAPSGSSAFIVTVQAPNTAGSIALNGSVTTSQNDPNGTNNAATQPTLVTSPSTTADVSITKNGPQTAIPNTTITYTIVVTNSGPASASNVTVQDPTPAHLTFVSNSGACTTPFPCSLGTMTSGQTKTIVAQYTVQPGTTTSIKNTATVTTTSNDPNPANNSASVITASGCPGAPAPIAPSNGQQDVPLSGTLNWTFTGAQSYRVFFGPAGTGCQTLFATTGGTSVAYGNLQQNTEYEWRVESVTPGCPSPSSGCFRFRTATICSTPPPTLVSPVGGAFVGSPITLNWTAVSGAASYDVFAGAGTTPALIGTTSTNSLTVTLPDGAYTWYVVADGVPNCGPLQSAVGNFIACSLPAAPVASIVAETTSGQTYTLQWDAVPGASRYEVDEANNDAFTNAQTTSTTATSLPFTKTASNAVPFFYRVRAFAACDGRPGPNSIVVRVVVVPAPSPTAQNPNANAPFGSTRVIVQQIFVPGQGSGNVTYTASADSPRVTVTPGSGPLPPQGVLLTITIDVTGLPNGTFTFTVVVVVNDGLPSSNGVAAHGSSTKKTPVSVTLVTPVTPATTTTPSDDSLIIPSVGHLDGFNSQWRSDIRVANTAAAAARYRLIFTPADAAIGVKETTIDVDAGATTALDDVVRSWFGVGSLGEASNGVLEIRPISGSNKAVPLATVSKTTAVSSRTYNVTGNGTLGQFIPAVPFLDFIGRAAGGQTAKILSLQQISQSDAFRTNLGLVEGSGKPADVVVSIFNATGVKLREVPFSLRGGEQRQLNSFLAQQGITLANGRLEVVVLGGEGRVTAYASVVDGASGDPLLVNPVQLGAAKATKYVLPGVADLNTSLASWRTDMRILNAATSLQTALLTFYPQNNGGTPLQATLTVSPGETRSLDNVLQTLFQTHDTGGAVHVETANDSTLVVTGRTYNQTSAGTFGQFIPAVTPAEAVGAGERALQILQVEESVRYRTNLGLSEVSGKPARVEVTVTLPDSKISPRLELDLAPNEFRQTGILRELGLDGVYNARIAVRVVSGEGRVTAYGSVVDMVSSDPTYVMAQ